MDALMPGGGISSVSSTDVLPDVSGCESDGDKRYRNRPKKERAVKRTYSFYPSTVRALEMYADDNGMSYSQVINLALRQMIPKFYFDVR